MHREADVNTISSLKLPRPPSLPPSLGQVRQLIQLLEAGRAPRGMYSFSTGESSRQTDPLRRYTAEEEVANQCEGVLGCAAGV